MLFSVCPTLKNYFWKKKHQSSRLRKDTGSATYLQVTNTFDLNHPFQVAMAVQLIFKDRLFDPRSNDPITGFGLVFIISSILDKGTKWLLCGGKILLLILFGFLLIFWNSSQTNNSRRSFNYNWRANNYRNREATTTSAQKKLMQKYTSGRI